MRGKYATRATNKREHDLATEVAQLRDQLAKERAAHHAAAQQLKTEITALHSEMQARAKVKADAAIKAAKAELQQAMKDQGLSFDLIRGLETQRDRLMFNACRYLSMREGIGPLDALEWVWTWFTDRDCYALPGRDAEWLMLGLPKDGWVAAQLRRQNERYRKRQAKRNYTLCAPETVSLDKIDADNDERVHPDYRRLWRKHYENVKHRGGLVAVESDGTETLVG